MAGGGTDGGLGGTAGTQSVAGNASDAGAPGQSGAPGVAGAAGAMSDPSAELYDPDRLPRFDIDLPQASVDALNVVTRYDHPEKETYVPGTFTYDKGGRNEVVTEIGVRLKGEGSFRRLNQKAAFRLKFDEFVEKQPFRGLRRMTLNNMVEDPSFVAERLAFDVFRAANLPAPRCNSALLYVNGALYGVYANVEAEDKTFLRRWFASDDGNLYEEGQVDFVPGAETSFDLETNEMENDRSDLANLIQVFQAARPASYLADLGQALDTAHFLRFTAAEAAVNQWDMYTYTVFYPNNFRIYNDPTRMRFVFLPWGMDMSMKPFRDSGKANIALFDLARRGDRSGAPITAGLMFQRCLESDDCRARYAEAVREIITVYENLNLEERAQRYFMQLRSQIQADPRKEYTMDQIERGPQGLDSVLRTIRDRPAALNADLTRAGL